MEMNMKKILLSLTLLAAAGSALADGRHGYWGGSGRWVAPALIGGVIGYELGRPRYVYDAPPVIIQQPVIVQQPQVIYQQPQVIYQQAPVQQKKVCRTDYIIVDNIQRTAQTCWFE